MENLINVILPVISELATNIFWVLIGFLFGLSLYFWRLGQLKNELKSLFSLMLTKYKHGDAFKIKAGVDVKSIDGQETRTTTSPQDMIFGYERGIDWIFRSEHGGLIRSRVMYASFSSDHTGNNIPKYFVISHFDLEK